MSKLPKAWSSWRAIEESDPKRLVKIIEAGIELRNERKAHEATAQALLKEESELKNFLIDKFNKEDLKEVKTRLGVAKFVTKDIPIMDPETGGWDAIYKYISKHKAWELLQKRLGEKACQERWADGEKIPGVKAFTKMDVKLGDAE